MISLLILSGLVGLIIGIFLSKFAEEELQGGEKYFRWFRDGAFIFLTGFFLFEYGLVTFVSILLLLSLAIRVVPEHVKMRFIAFVSPILVYYRVSDQSTIQPLAGIYFVIGMLEAGAWCSKYRKRLKKPKELVHYLFRDEFLYLFIPIILLVISIVFPDLYHY